MTTKSYRLKKKKKQLLCSLNKYSTPAQQPAFSPNHKNRKSQCLENVENHKRDSATSE